MKKAVLYYSDCPFFGGSENMVANLLNSTLVKNRFSVSFMYKYNVLYQMGVNSRIENRDITLIPVKLYDQFIHKTIVRKIKPTILSLPISYLVLAIWKYIYIILVAHRLFKFLKKLKIDVIHINNGGYPAAFSCYSMVIAAKFAGMKNIIYVVNNIAQGYRNPVRWLDYFLDMFVKKYVSIFITGSSYARIRLAEVLRLKNSDVVNIYNGVGLLAPNMVGEEFWATLEINKSPKYIFGIVANLEKRKGHKYLLDAIAILKKKKSQEEMPIFIIEGTGNEFTNIIKQIDFLNIGSFVKCVGLVDNIYNLYYNCDAVILPSVCNEDFPNVIIEAMGMGKPVVATRVAGIPEQIDDGVNGILVNPGDPTDLARAIESLLTCESFGDLGVKGREKYLTNFTVAESIKQYLLTYETIMEKI